MHSKSQQSLSGEREFEGCLKKTAGGGGGSGRTGTSESQFHVVNTAFSEWHSVWYSTPVLAHAAYQHILFDPRSGLSLHRPNATLISLSPTDLYISTTTHQLVQIACKYMHTNMAVADDVRSTKYHICVLFYKMYEGASMMKP